MELRDRNGTVWEVEFREVKSQPNQPTGLGLGLQQSEQISLTSSRVNLQQFNCNDTLVPSCSTQSLFTQSTLSTSPFATTLVSAGADIPMLIPQDFDFQTPPLPPHCDTEIGADFHASRSVSSRVSQSVELNRTFPPSFLDPNVNHGVDWGANVTTSDAKHGDDPKDVDVNATNLDVWSKNWLRLNFTDFERDSDRSSFDADLNLDWNLTNEEIIWDQQMKQCSTAAPFDCMQTLPPPSSLPLTVASNLPSPTLPCSSLFSLVSDLDFSSPPGIVDWGWFGVANTVTKPGSIGIEFQTQRQQLIPNRSIITFSILFLVVFHLLFLFALCLCLYLSDCPSQI